MFKRRAIRHAFSCAAGLLLTCTLSNGAAAQFSTEDFANQIKNQFSLPYESGQLGVDWCYNVQTEPGDTWWYYKLKDEELTAKQIWQPVRFQATYKTKTYRGYSSVFLGLIVPDGVSVNYQPAFTIGAIASTGPDISKVRSPKPTAGTSLPVALKPGALAEPTSPSPSSCSMKEFLAAYIGTPYGIALGDANDLHSDPESVPDKTPRYWTFANRTHKVHNVFTLPIFFSDVKGNPILGTLVIGFGGGAGP